MRITDKGVFVNRGKGFRFLKPPKKLIKYNADVRIVSNQLFAFKIGTLLDIIFFIAVDIYDMIQRKYFKIIMKRVKKISQ